MSGRNVERPTIGFAAVCLAALSMMATMVLVWLTQEAVEESRSFTTRLSDAAVSIFVKDTEPESEAVAPSRMLDYAKLASAAISLIAIVLAGFALVRREVELPSYAAIVLGLTAFVFQVVVLHPLAYLAVLFIVLVVLFIRNPLLFFEN